MWGLGFRWTEPTGRRARDDLIHDPHPPVKVSHMVPTLECPNEPRKDWRLSQGLILFFPLLQMAKSCLWQRILKPVSNLTYGPINSSSLWPEPYLNQGNLGLEDQ